MNFRKWVTPLTAGSFVLVGVTGLLMFFEVRLGWIAPVHEWLSLIFVVGALLHLWLNWKPMKAHLRRPVGAVLVGAFVLITVLAVVFPVTQERQSHLQGKRLGRSLVPVLLQARVGTLAELVHRSPDEVRAQLARQGVRFASDSTSLEEAARSCGVAPVKALSALVGDHDDD